MAIPTPFAAALAKAWIYEQHPELTKMSKGQMVELGQSVSVAPMPVKAKAEVDEVFAKLADYKGQINAKSAKVDELTKALAAKDAEIAALSAKVKEFEGQKKGEAEALFVTTEARIVEFTGKLEALLKEVEEVKKTGVVVAGVAGVAAAAGAAAPRRCRSRWRSCRNCCRNRFWFLRRIAGPLRRFQLVEAHLHHCLKGSSSGGEPFFFSLTRRLKALQEGRDSGKLPDQSREQEAMMKYWLMKTEPGCFFHR